MTCLFFLKTLTLIDLGVKIVHLVTFHKTKTVQNHHTNNIHNFAQLS